MTNDSISPAIAAQPMQVNSRASAGNRVVSLFALTLGMVGGAYADGIELTLKHGTEGANYARSGLGLRFAPVWAADWGRWKSTLRPEVELGHFRYTGSGTGPDSLAQGGVNGVLRIHYGDNPILPYAEIGLGLSLFSRDRLGGKRFSTHFQFSQHLGVGIEFDRRWTVGWQYSHYSNADIDLPNDGIDLHQLIIGARF